ncbi:hypothetical protein LshimejAT787_0802040 [Lyophyllum shimeji]|uniref:Uncharacterized protein n=1 Tax=Lyophyllum shimeji TaxID=47721 RepID=A0A9P3PQT7_LYOSH|nr:hypothetical protein LshimejAT787_0802040 [Lyophyllum shimeji]
MPGQHVSQYSRKLRDENLNSRVAADTTYHVLGDKPPTTGRALVWRAQVERRVAVTARSFCAPKLLVAMIDVCS